MITKDSVESAYCFFHQKWQVYAFSNNAVQRDDIEYAIASYVEGMNAELYTTIAAGKRHFLMDHQSFDADMPAAIESLDRLMSEMTSGR